MKDVKITDLTWESYRWPRDEPVWSGAPHFFGGERNLLSHIGLTVAKVHTDAGLVGIGVGLGGLPARDISERFRFKEKLAGHNPLNTERLWHELWVPRWYGRRGLETLIMSIIDIAVWDLAGKVLEQPVYRLLGGYKEKIPTYSTGGYYAKNKGVRGLQAEAEKVAADGFRSFKMRVGGLPLSEDVARVKAVRDVVGDDFELKLDASNSWTGKSFEAIRFAHEVEHLKPYWLEEPVAPDDYAGHAIIGERTRIPVATGENEYTCFGFRDLITLGKPAIIMPDPMIGGGITQLKKVMALAEAHDVAVSLHGNQEINVHIGAAFPNVLSIEFFDQHINPLWGQDLTNTLRLNSDGTVSPSDRPGLGFELNMDVLEKYRVSI
ncbi:MULTISPECIES: mandelate racemase/muconate lactonizing enzyme family protein [unclassified Shinella]|uniref:mandelate racemase/muconate lactonizing enzyme family protein n=1 Tax=unclassified Shinella TaxID=2643062 RepID=UPI00225D7ED9|nr:mandelate racemase/muconate lactonizing enzyme family protein [Shinella sp. YE25]MDC7260127.1 mandelate racemase/muconate lactonizing enzyme family protein [Shinella sp. YE25]CAI0341132.1 Mandelate racemase/muconate lactonizing enzyme family protein [Rhizobiaceae bacterium]CAK7262167.1 Mandelate racemase/muconate lactonizing enzyme family protein [Shinella sp. WSC3-e]